MLPPVPYGILPGAIGWWEADFCSLPVKGSQTRVYNLSTGAVELGTLYRTHEQFCLRFFVKL